MKIVYDFPPNYADIVSKFPAVSRSTSVVFTYGDEMFMPGGGMAPDHLQEHEHMHTRQQLLSGGAAKWWAKYLADDVFRFEQELQAYQRQYRYCKQTESREQHREKLRQFARDLASPIYGSIVSKGLAKDLICG